MSLKIFLEEFKDFQELPKRGVFVNIHSGYLKISPAEYTKDYCMSKDLVVSKKRIYQAIAEAAEEAKELKLAKNSLPIGYDTHNIVYIEEGFGEKTKTYKQFILLDVSNPSIKLEAFEKLKKEYNLDNFELGRTPFINSKISAALREALNSKNSISKVSSIFTRKRDGALRVYVTSAFNELYFGMRSTPHIHLDNDQMDKDIITLEEHKPDIEL